MAGGVSVAAQAAEPRRARLAATGLKLALGPFLVSRALLMAVAVVANRLLPYGPVADLGRGTPLQGFLGWDAVHYLQIARAGYGTRPGAAGNGFFPLLPILQRAFGASDLAALLLGLALGLLALAGVAACTADVLDVEAARRAAWLAAFWPTAFYWSAPYTEALFVALLAGSLWAAGRGRAGWTGLLGFCAGLTRPTGVLVAIPLALLLRGRERLVAFAPAAGGAAFAVYLWVHTGSPAALAAGSTDHGNLAPGRPWEVVGTAFLWARYGDWQQVAELPVIGVTAVLTGALCRRVWRERLGGFAGPAIACALALVSPPILAGTASSFARYAMVAIPLYWPLTRLRLAAVLAVEIPICIVWTAFATTGHLTP